MREPLRYIKVQDAAMGRQLLGISDHAAMALRTDASVRLLQLRRRDVRMAKKVGGVVAIGLHGARALLRDAVRYRPRIWFMQSCLPFLYSFL